MHRQDRKKKKVEKYLSKELFQKTEENFQQTQKLQDPRQSPSGKRGGGQRVGLI